MTPMRTEALLLPRDDRLRLDELQSILPAQPQACQPRPEQAIGWVEPRARARPFVYGDLMLEHENPQVQGLT
jgi:hypothetical protein